MTYTPSNVNGQATKANSAPVVIASDQGALAVTGTFYQATQPVSIATAPVLVAGTALIGKVGIDQVTANANEVVTKTGSVTSATLTAETTKVIGTVNIAAAQTVAVTNAGTFATQATLTAETTKVIGTVNIAAAQTLATVTTVGAVTAITNALPAGTNAIGKLSANSGVDIGDVDVTSIAAGTNLIGDVSLQPRTSNGLSVANFNSGDTYTALTATAQVIKASAGNLYGYYMMNPNTATAYVMIYNIAAASVTVGTSTAQCVFSIPAGAAANLMMPYPISFSNAGWSIAAATTGAGNTAPTTPLEVQIWFK